MSSKEVCGYVGPQNGRYLLCTGGKVDGDGVRRPGSFLVVGGTQAVRLCGKWVSRQRKWESRWVSM